jgi:Ca2+-binding EF-hand superfamily protein
MALSDLDNSGDVSIDEFISHLQAHEQKLRQVFRQVDRDQNGQLDVHELMEASRRLGIPLSLKDATSMITR